ncbi:hypothetical protein NDN08_000906 [Rhodosorus marinus]|uniref:Uncharacterized protein n=1 Tax=Rhodosorus marinus TaxID=101924 RepID=A0AAV8UTH2_9RHOD|nr:hypothetical protein NDN08_000906 [Rhodosorus marinus]
MASSLPNIVRLPSGRRKLVCTSVRSFWERLEGADRVAGVLVTKKNMSIAVSDSKRDVAASFGFLERVEVNKDKQILIDALEAAKKYEAGFRVGGLVVLDRHREAGEKIPDESNEMIAYVRELFDRRDFPHLKGMLFVSDRDVAVHTSKRTDDFARAVTRNAKNRFIETRSKVWDQSQPRLVYPTESYFENSSKLFSLSSRIALQTVLDSIKLDQHGINGQVEDENVHERQETAES